MYSLRRRKFRSLTGKQLNSHRNKARESSNAMLHFVYDDYRERFLSGLRVDGLYTVSFGGFAIPEPRGDGCRVLPPILKDATSLGHGHENVLGQTFILRPAVEIFYETVVCRFPGTAVPQAHAMFLRPFIQGSTCELRPLSVRRQHGKRPRRIRRSSTSTTRWPESDIYPPPKPGLSQRSGTVRMRTRLPDIRLSLTKSMPHCSSGPLGVRWQERGKPGCF